MKVIAMRLTLALKFIMAGFPTGKRVDLMQLSGTIPVTIVGEIQTRYCNIDTVLYDPLTPINLVHT